MLVFMEKSSVYYTGTGTCLFYDGNTLFCAASGYSGSDTAGFLCGGDFMDFFVFVPAFVPDCEI